MTVINSALALKIDGVDAVRAYMDGAIVWPPGTGNRVSASLALKSGSTVTLTVSLSGEAPTSFKVWYSLNGGEWQYWTEKTAAGAFDYTTSYSTKIKMKVEAYYSGYSPDIAVITNEVQIGAAPPPPTLQKTSPDLAPVEWMSYSGSGDQRTTESDGSPIVNAFSGQVSSTWGNQKCSFRFNLPSDLANCISIDKVELSIWNKHCYQSTRNVQLALHHYGDLQSSGTSGSTQTFRQAPAAKPGWVGNTGWTNSGSRQWMDITNDLCPSRYTVKEEFRRWGARGVTLNPGPTTSNVYYGYVDPGSVRLRFTYTVYT